MAMAGRKTSYINVQEVVTQRLSVGALRRELKKNRVLTERNEKDNRLSLRLSVYEKYPTVCAHSNSPKAQPFSLLRPRQESDCEDEGALSAKQVTGVANKTKKGKNKAIPVCIHYLLFAMFDSRTRR